jgi:hypothetical protein
MGQISIGITLFVYTISGFEHKFVLQVRISYLVGVKYEEKDAVIDTAE